MANSTYFLYPEPAPLSEPFEDGEEISGVRSTRGEPVSRGSGVEIPSIILDGTNCDYLTEDTQTTTGRMTKAIWLWRNSTNVYGIIGK